MSRASWLKSDSMTHVLAALMPANRLVLVVSMETGLRVGDVLALRRETLEKGQRFTIKEQKTGKPRRVRLRTDTWQRCLAQSGRVWIFEGRTDWRKHRTRAAVYKDIHRAGALFRSSGVVPRSANLGTHTARKVWAVSRYAETGGDLSRIQREMNHSSPAVTMLYVMADSLEKKPPNRNRASARSAVQTKAAPPKKSTVSRGTQRKEKKSTRRPRPGQ